MLKYMSKNLIVRNYEILDQFFCPENAEKHPKIGRSRTKCGAPIEPKNEPFCHGAWACYFASFSTMNWRKKYLRSRHVEFNMLCFTKSGVRQ
jgi:hypothetical protein